MKQSAAKTLGVAALGAAFAVAGAGAANAAPALPETPALGNAAGSLPVDGLAKSLPGAGESLTQGTNALSSGVAAAQPAIANLLAEGPAAPVAGLLGGLPIEGLPTHGTPVNGIPLG
ncbi:ATP-binding protein [Streptomyces sp. NPDC017991]|uniref:ATP-binding protein n=1 Tax=Streptomyces sp. NPDC017991 TaxID=3365026 RepID=UPI0037968422